LKSYVVNHRLEHAKIIQTTSHHASRISKSRFGIR
jgi:hypothetical protein